MAQHFLLIRKITHIIGTPRNGNEPPRSILRIQGIALGW